MEPGSERLPYLSRHGSYNAPQLATLVADCVEDDFAEGPRVVCSFVEDGKAFVLEVLAVVPRVGRKLVGEIAGHGGRAGGVGRPGTSTGAIFNLEGIQVVVVVKLGAGRVPFGDRIDV